MSKEAKQLKLRRYKKGEKIIFAVHEMLGMLFLLIFRAIWA